MKRTIVLMAATTLAASVWAKLPAPSDEAKAKAAEAAAKAAHGGKVEGYLLCKSQNKVVAHYAKTAATQKDGKVPAAPAACTDPGPFVATAATGTPPAAAAPAVAAAPASAPKKP